MWTRWKDPELNLSGKSVYIEEEIGFGKCLFPDGNQGIMGHSAVRSIIYIYMYIIAFSFNF